MDGARSGSGSCVFLLIAALLAVVPGSGLAQPRDTTGRPPVGAVAVSFTPASGPPGATLQLRVTNGGAVTDTFDLALGGPAAGACSLGAASVRLAPGASQDVAVAIGPVDPAPAGPTPLTGTATSRGNADVMANALAMIETGGADGAGAGLDPASVNLAAPGGAGWRVPALANQAVGSGVGTGPAVADAGTDQPVGRGQTVTYVLRLTANHGQASPAGGALAVALNDAPVAVAGRGRNVAVNAPVGLDGTDSFDPDGDLVTYEWTVEGAPAASGVTDASLDDATAPAPSFVPDVAGDYVLRLVVRDPQAASEPSRVTVRAFAANVPPNADAGRDRHVPVGVAAGLDGGASADPDGGPGPLTFSWRVLARPPGSAVTDASLSGAAQAVASFTPDVAGEYRLRLRVGDDEALSDDELRITAHAGHVTPNADAGADVDVAAGTPVTLDGRASEDPDGGPEPLTFRWRLVSRPAGSGLENAGLAGADTAQPRFTPDAVGPYVLELTVFDGADGDFDNVRVVAGAPTGPTCQGRPATIFVRDGRIVGGPDHGRRYRGVLRGIAGDDVIAGTEDQDHVKGGGGADVVCGGAGHDVIEGGRGADLLDGGADDDHLKGQGGPDVLHGGEGRDVLEGNAGGDHLVGEAGDDWLKGEQGDDTLAGGPGRNRLDGGAGTDACTGEGRRTACEP